MKLSSHEFTDSRIYRLMNLPAHELTGSMRNLSSTLFVVRGFLADQNILIHPFLSLPHQFAFKARFASPIPMPSALIQSGKLVTDWHDQRPNQLG
jgi:hypothetical protein